MPGRPAIRPRNGCLAHPARILQALEHEHAGGKVDAVDRKRQCLGQAAAGIGESHAESADLAVVLLGRTKESIALAGREIFPRPVPCVEAKARRGRSRLLCPGAAVFLLRWTLCTSAAAGHIASR
jgi:hypothetical protein